MDRFVVRMLASRHARPSFVVVDTQSDAPYGYELVGLEGQGFCERLAARLNASHGAAPSAPALEVVFLDADDPATP